MLFDFWKKNREKAQNDEESTFEHDFRLALTSLEKKLHNVESTEVITKESIKATCLFHDADWCGILIADYGTRVYSPVAWYERSTGGMTPTLFKENEFFEDYPRWVDALASGEPVIIEDAEALKETNPEEYAHYRRLNAHGIIGAPFGDRPTGFLVVRNPKRYKTIPDFVKMTAFVGLSTYYLQELMEGMDMIRGSDAQNQETGASVRINLFGVPEIKTAHGSINELQYKSVNGWKLLTYLTLKKRPVPARVIAADIWPDIELENQTDNIRGMIYRFRTKLSFLEPGDLITNNQLGYCLNPEIPFSCDLYEFEELYQQAEKEKRLQPRVALLKRANELYRGAVFEQYSDEPWLMNDVNHYGLLYLQVTSALMGSLAELQDYQCIQDYASRSLKIMPGNVHAYYWMIVSLNRLGGSELAKREMLAAKGALTEEEYAELTERVKAEMERREASLPRV